MQRTSGNLSALRLALAIDVAIYHVCLISGVRPSWLTPFLVPTLAVQIFFVLSGYLIFVSLARTNGLWDYLQRRMMRIYPAYLLVVAASGAVFSPTASNWLSYVAWNAVFLNFVAPGDVGGFAINGSLWTIKVEVAFYIVAPGLFVAAMRYGAMRVLGAAIVGSLLYRAAMHDSLLAHQFPGQLCLFAAGGLIHFYGYRFVSILAAMPQLRMPRRDLSYGIYLVHFPIAHVFRSFGVIAIPLTLLASIAVASFLARLPTSSLCRVLRLRLERARFGS